MVSVEQLKPEVMKPPANMLVDSDAMEVLYREEMVSRDKSESAA